MSDQPTKPIDPVDFNGDAPRADRPEPVDLRGTAAATRDRSTHRRYAWLYEDLLN